MKTLAFFAAISLMGCAQRQGHVDRYHRAIFTAPKQEIKIIDMGRGPFDWKHLDDGSLLWTSFDDRGYYITSILPGPGNIAVYHK